jgi:hypothetical protein
MRKFRENISLAKRRLKPFYWLSALKNIIPKITRIKTGYPGEAGYPTPKILFSG